MYLRGLALVSILALAACGGGSATTPGTATSNTTPTSGTGQLVPTSFAVGLPATTNPASANRRSPKYLGAGSASVAITLNTVNSAVPPNGLTTTVTSSILPGSCPCSVSGPLVPPGSDNFTFTTYDGANATGNVIATFSNTYTIVAGSANSGNSVTLQGVPKTFSITGIPAGTAGTAFGSPVTLTVNVKDADGNTIASGSYADPVTLTDSDSTGVQGSQINVNGGSFGTSVSLTASTSVVKLNYGGLAIASATLTASATGATNGTAAFTPTLSSIVYSGPVNGSSLPELDLYAPSGTGSTATFTASEVGWTNSPYSKSLTATTSGCTSIGAITGSFTFTAVASPVAGSCTITIHDGAGQSEPVTGTYTSSGFGVN